MLEVVELPPLGGDTLGADMAKAHDLLDDDTKQTIDDLTATHDGAPGAHLRLAVPLPLAAGFGRVLGQPRDPARRLERLPAGAPRDGTGHDRRRQAR